MFKLLYMFSNCFIFTLIIHNCITHQIGEGFNIYKDFQISKNNEDLRDGETNKATSKDELILPSVAAKVSVDDTTKRNGLLFRNLMISREIPEPKLLHDVLMSDPFATLMIIPESKVTMPRVVKNFGLRKVKKSGLYDELDTNDYYFHKRIPGSVLTWTLAPSRSTQKIITMRSDQGKHFQPSSFVATMGKRSYEDTSYDN